MKYADLVTHWQKEHDICKQDVEQRDPQKMWEGGNPMFPVGQETAGSPGKPQLQFMQKSPKKKGVASTGVNKFSPNMFIRINPDDFPFRNFPELTEYNMDEEQWINMLRSSGSGPRVGVHLMRHLFSAEERLPESNFMGARGRMPLDPSGVKAKLIIDLVNRIYPGTTTQAISKAIDVCNRSFRFQTRKEKESGKNNVTLEK